MVRVLVLGWRYIPAMLVRLRFSLFLVAADRNVQRTFKRFNSFILRITFWQRTSHLFYTSAGTRGHWHKPVLRNAELEALQTIRCGTGAMLLDFGASCNAVERSSNLLAVNRSSRLQTLSFLPRAIRQLCGQNISDDCLGRDLVELRLRLWIPYGCASSLRGR